MIKKVLCIVLLVLGLGVDLLVDLVNFPAFSKIILLTVSLVSVLAGWFLFSKAVTRFGIFLSLFWVSDYIEDCFNPSLYIGRIINIVLALVGIGWYILLYKKRRQQEKIGGDPLITGQSGDGSNIN